MALKVVLVGGSGFLGPGLQARLTADGDAVTVIGRSPAAARDGVRTVQWDGKSLGDWVAALEGADVVEHLAGKRVDCRPTEANIDELISSREGTVRLVGQALRQLDTRPTTWVQLSSLAIFGDAGDTEIDEITPPPTTGPRQQVEVCHRWEAAFREATDGLDRAVLLRPAIGIGGEGDPATRQLAVGAELYSIAQPDTVDGATIGEPNTFIWGYKAGEGGYEPRVIAIAAASAAFDSTAASVPGVQVLQG